MKILAFETSCDDTSIALFENDTLVSMHTASQIKIHNETGGAVASTLSQTLKIPVLEIDHIQAHIFSNFLERQESEIVFPLVCLTVSGGHNEIYYMKSMFEKEKIWQTQDDAAGEAFDKVAKMMWLGYPGGPIISKLADEYTPPQSPSIEGEANLGKQGEQVIRNKHLFPRVFLEKSEFGFSFSGLKSAVKREVDARKTPPQSPSIEGEANLGEQGELTLEDQRELSYEFQNAVNEVLTYKLILAAEEKQVKTVLLAGWVSANDNLNERISKQAQKHWLNFFAPTKKLYCMDNAAMIGILAYYRITYKQFEHQIWGVKVGSW